MKYSPTTMEVQRVAEAFRRNYSRVAYLGLVPMVMIGTAMRGQLAHDTVSLRLFGALAAPDDVSDEVAARLKAETDRMRLEDLQTMSSRHPVALGVARLNLEQAASEDDEALRGFEAL